MEEGIAKATTAGWEPVWGETISKDFPLNDFYKVAIFLPNGKLDTGETTADCRKEAVAELVRWCTLRNMKYIVLYKGGCTWENFSTVLSKPSVSYVYMVAHGGNHVGSVHRLYFYVSGALGLNDIEPVFSYKGGLPEGWDTNPLGHSMESLGLYQSTQIRCVYMTVCYQGQSTEMAERWINYEWGEPIDQLFCGWVACASGSDPDWKDWDYQFWCRWGSGQELASDVIDYLFMVHPYIWFQFQPLGWTQMYFTTSGN
jgi:hypothetical protein